MNFKISDTAKSIAIFVLVLVLISAVVTVIANAIDSEEEELLEFTKTATLFHSRVDDFDIIPGYDPVVELVKESEISLASEVNLTIQDKLLMVEGTIDQMGWLFPPNEKALDLWESIMNEFGLFEHCYFKLSQAWQAKVGGDVSLFESFLNASANYYEQALTARDQNVQELYSLQQQLEEELN
jgi:hypothetical protein